MMRPNSVFIIAEAGSNWKAGSPRQDWTRARVLIAAAAEAGADAIKFQTFRAEAVYVPNAGTSDYLSANGIRKPINEIFKEMAMPHAMIPRLATYAQSKKIQFLSSFFSSEDFQAVNPYVETHKIASYEISHPGLLRLAARSGKPLILSTGASTLEDIDWAVRFFKKNGGRSLYLLQCTAKYPAPFSALNLRAIPELARRYGVPAGLSDHSREPVTAPVAAVALGARIIEKHFTLSNRLSGPDHAFAVTPPELKQMVQAVRDCERALGDGRKRVLAEEKELRAYAQRAVQAIRPIAKGEGFTEGENIAILRPGKQPKGLHPRFLKRIERARAKRRIPLGRGIRKEDLN